ncbi:chemotaxis protein CheX [Desulfitobacterium sp. AusDCA]|uniref:chemotaxis protein CheX n=2 Tax=Desulfitobacterium TaxID=36853 RepID=UPI003DA793BF
MNPELINPFLQATYDVCKQMFNIEIESREIKKTEELYVGKELNVLISIIGDVLGSVTYSFPKETALELVNLLSGMNMQEIDIFVTSALGEVGNIISGNAVSYLAKMNQKCDIAPPQVILGENRSISLANKESIVITLQTKIGEFTINLALKGNII